jgi:hypothetical protein
MVNTLKHHRKSVWYRARHVFVHHMCAWIQAVWGAAVDRNHKEVTYSMVSQAVTTDNFCVLFTPAFSSHNLSTRPSEGCSFQILGVKFQGRNNSVDTVLSISNNGESGGTYRSSSGRFSMCWHWPSFNFLRMMTVIPLERKAVTAIVIIQTRHDGLVLRCCSQ